MKLNEGMFDRLIRISAGLLLLGLTQYEPKSSWGLIGLVPFFTGLVGYCPLYAMFGINTCSVKRRKI